MLVIEICDIAYRNGNRVHFVVGSKQPATRMVAVNKSIRSFRLHISYAVEGFLTPTGLTPCNSTTVIVSFFANPD